MQGVVSIRKAKSQGIYYRDLILEDRGSWLCSSVRLLSSGPMLELGVHREDSWEGEMDIKWGKARTSWDQYTPAGNRENRLNPVLLTLVA